MERRTLLKGAVALGASLAFGRRPAFASAADSRIEVLLDEPVGTISPAVYGHFTEMLGAVVYDGIWVGEDSKIQNTGGLRKTVIEKLRQIKVPMVRWPGGCFADSYDWADGVGAAARRPERGAFWRGEPNTFGTPEFMRFCRATGAEPYFAANVRSLSPLAFDHWIEYCNAPADKSSLGRMRADDGSREPYNVKYWGIGNEAWGLWRKSHSRRVQRRISQVHRLDSRLQGSSQVHRRRSRQRRSGLDRAILSCHLWRQARHQSEKRLRMVDSPLHMELIARQNARLGCSQGRCASVRPAGLVRSLP